ncbi:MAG: ATP-binding cassette domain-containing protein [Eubacteriales bacterium]|nr:ATP-binding cassette domain-containing protein [Eubacteriales bacterium]
MLELKNISKTFNRGQATERQLFKDFNLSLPAKEFVVVIGGNGSGKTTLLNLICGAARPDTGQIILNGEDLTSLPAHKHYERIGRVFQNPAAGVAPSLSLIENLALAENKNKAYNFSRAVTSKLRESLQERLKIFHLGLEDKLDAPVGSFSGGERQAVALLMATISPLDGGGQPLEYLILDEHTAALDPKAADTLMELTLKLIELDQLGAIMVTHNLAYAEKYGDRLLMLNQGQLVLDTRDPQEKISLLRDRAYLERNYAR